MNIVLELLYNERKRLLDRLDALERETKLYVEFLSLQSAKSEKQHIHYGQLLPLVLDVLKENDSLTVKEIHTALSQKGFAVRTINNLNSSLNGYRIKQKLDCNVLGKVKYYSLPKQKLKVA